jgi:hypothetical protein
MIATAAAPLVQFFIPGIVAHGLDVPQLATGCRTSNAQASRLSYRFTYRLSRGGPMYGCRIKASVGMTTVLMEQLYTLVEKAEAEGDSAMLNGCALALEAIQQQALNGNGSFR